MNLPESMDECFYFTKRAIGDGFITAWVLKPDCPSCKKAKIGKPVDSKTGSVKIRAKEYECPSCKHNVSKEEFEPTLSMNVKYTCPYCRHEGETTTAYKRNKFQGVDAYVFECQSCNKKIPITKKLKALKDKT